MNRLANKRIAGIVGAALVVIGVVFVLRSLAATSTTAFEPENGSLSGMVSIVNDSQASGGKYLQFGTASPSQPGTGGTTLHYSHNPGGEYTTQQGLGFNLGNVGINGDGYVHFRDFSVLVSNYWK